MKKCLKCGTLATDNSDFFCDNCGGALVESEKDVCKHCGAVVNHDYEFCTKCHTKLNPSASSYTQRTQEPTRRKSFYDKLLAPFISAAVVACILAVAVICGLFFMSDGVNKTPVGNPGAALIPHDKPVADDPLQEQAEDDEINHEEPEKTNRVLYDYDADSDDYYRIRMSRDDAASQVGAYRTVKSALHFADIYIPQGYTLYDKDFNIVDVENYTVVDTPSYDYYSPEEYLYDYDSGSDDYYRIRMSEDDAASQVGAYKTVKSALYYADIYCPQGYTLYDKDFNVIR